MQARQNANKFNLFRAAILEQFHQYWSLVPRKRWFSANKSWKFWFLSFFKQGRCLHLQPNFLRL